MLLMTLQCILTNLNNPDLNPRYVQIQLWISLHVCEFHYMVMNIINILHSLNHLSSPNKFINPNTSISIGTGLFGLVRMHCSAPVYSIIISDFSLCVCLEMRSNKSSCGRSVSTWSRSSWLQSCCSSMDQLSLSAVRKNNRRVARAMNRGPVSRNQAENKRRRLDKNKSSSQHKRKQMNNY